METPDFSLMTATREIVLFTLLLITLVGLMIYFRLAEGRRLKKKSLEAMSPDLREEIERERQENLEKKKRFEEAMKKAGGS